MHKNFLQLHPKNILYNAMITVFVSNSLETLKDKLSALLCEKLPASPISREIIVVQSQGMKKWLSLKLAESLGCWASFTFLFPNNFIDTVYSSVANEHSSEFNSIADNSISSFERDVLSWLLFDLLEPDDLGADADFSHIFQYLQNDIDCRKRWQLATRIAYLYDQYLTFRSDYIEGWEKHHFPIKNFHNDLDFTANWQWQKKLWEKISVKMKFPHRLSRYRMLQSAIERRELTIEKNIFSRAIIFGISFLPPLHLDALTAIASICDIYMFMLYPTKFDAHYNPSHDNQLLSSLGIAGSNFLEKLRKQNNVNFEYCFENESDKANNFLTIIQRDILHDARPNEPCEIPPDDQSIRIVSCHSPMREVEVVRDFVLDVLNSPDAPRLDEIVVMAPDIDTYAPYIDAVFSTSKPEIPYTIADRSPVQENPLISAFFALLDAAVSRFETSVVLDLLEKKPIQEKISITDENLSTIKTWIAETRIRWGFSQKDKEKLNLPPVAENTWKSALNRMFLGYALSEDVEFNGIYPYQFIEGELADLLGKLSRFIHDLHALSEILSNSFTLIEWEKKLRVQTELFLPHADEYEQHFKPIEDAFSQLARMSEFTEFTRKVPFPVIRLYLESILRETASARNFFNGTLTFCAMLPMRSIPFKVICLIGMNDDAFPRREVFYAFDLMRKEPRPGDRLIRNEDKYLFLEALISAKEKLYISYTGQSINDSSTIPPSVVVSEFLDYLTKRASMPIENLVAYHPLHPFSSRYFTGDAFFSYSREYCETAQQFLNSSKTEMTTFIDGAVAEPEFKDLLLSDIQAFLINPARYFLRNGIGLRFKEDEINISDAEIFMLGALDAYAVKSILLEKFLEMKDSCEFNEKLMHKFKSYGMLPYGTVGSVAIEEMFYEVKNLYHNIAEYVDAENFAPIPFRAKITKYNRFIDGTLKNVNTKCQLFVRPAKIKAKDILSAWVCHLALCALEGEKYPKETILVGTDSDYRQLSEVNVLKPIQKDDALHELGKLYEIAIIHERNLFHFIPECSLAYYMKQKDGGSDREALEEAKKKWVSPNKRSFQESDDPYMNLCFGKMDEEARFGCKFKENAREIFSPIFQFISGVTHG